MKKVFKWFLYTLVLVAILIVGVLATAYWNRDKLLDNVTAELNKGINGKFYIGSIDFTFLHNFPNFSITLHDVYLRDEQYYVYKQDIFKGKTIFADVALYPLLRKEIKITSLSVAEADVFIFKARNGWTNTEVFKKTQDSVSSEKQTTNNSLLLNLQKIAFKNVAVIYCDSTKSKSISLKFVDTNQRVAQIDSGYAVAIQGKMHFDSLFLNPKGGGFLKGKDLAVNLNLRIDPISKMLTLEQSALTYKKNDISLTGHFELKKMGEFALRFASTAINPAEAKELLNPKLQKTLSKFSMKDPITVQVNLSGKSIPGDIPNVHVEFETTRATLRYGILDFTSLALKGSFTNQIDSTKLKNDKNSKVAISSFKGVMEKLPVDGSVVFTELQDPIIKLNFTSALSYKDLNNHLDFDRFELSKGKFITTVSYSGKLSEYLDPTRVRYEGKLQGRIQTTDAALHYKPKNIKLDQVNLQCTFNEKSFTIKDLSANVNGSPVAINGSVENFIPFFIQPKNKGYVRLNVSSPDFDLTSFASKRTLQKKSKEQSSKDRKKLTDQLDKVYEKLEFDVNVVLDKLKFRKFVGSNFKGRVRLDHDMLRANPISMNVAGGNMNLNFSLKDLFDPVSPMEMTGKVSNADIKELFLLFNNFNQKTIIAENLAGTISVDVDFRAEVDEAFTLLTPSMQGTLDCKISDGGLIDFEPMENMSNFLFKKRDFSDVQFAELNSAFTIAGTNMDISRMEIQSSVLSLFLEGRYSFTDSTSLSVQIPLSNLKKRDKDFKPQNIGTHAKAGPSVFLHVYRDKDINSKIKIDYDPFKKWAKN